MVDYLITHKILQINFYKTFFGKFIDIFIDKNKQKLL